MSGMRRGDAASATMALQSQGSPTDVLGVNIAAPEEYAPSILVPIPRAKGRGLLGLAEGNLLPFAGDDVWMGSRRARLPPALLPELVMRFSL